MAMLLEPSCTRTLHLCWVDSLRLAGLFGSAVHPFSQPLDLELQVSECPVHLHLFGLILPFLDQGSGLGLMGPFLISFNVLQSCLPGLEGRR